MKKALTIKIDEGVIEDLRFLIYSCPSLSINSFCESVIRDELNRCFTESDFGSADEFKVIKPNLKCGRKITLKE